MPYVLVRESFINGCCCVEGLPLNEAKILGEKRIFFGIRLIWTKFTELNSALSYMCVGMKQYSPYLLFLTSQCTLFVGWNLLDIMELVVSLVYCHCSVMCPPAPWSCGSM